VTYWNDVVSLKVCKVFDTSAGAAPTGVSSASFTETASNATAGPNTPPAVEPIVVPNGTPAAPQCSQPQPYAPGTNVSVTEGIIPGTKVESIVTTGAYSAGPAGTSITGRSTNVLVGTPISPSNGIPGDEVVITFTNEDAAPGQLKICKIAGTSPGAPVGTSFNFTVSGDPGVTTTVQVGSCAVVGGAGSAFPFPFNSTQTITEAGTPSNQAIAVSSVPTNVSEIVGSTPTATSELVQPPTNTGGTANPTLGAVGASSSVQVVIGEVVTTEVSFTNVDPPAGVTIPTAPIITVPNPGGLGVTSGVGVTIPGVPSISSIASSIPSVVNSSTGSLTPTALGSSLVKPLTAKQKAALKKADTKTLGNVEANIARYQSLVKHTSGSIKKLAERRLVELKAEATGLKAQIRKL